MKPASEHSADFVGQFAALAKSLASLGVVIAQLRLDYSTFGGWSLVATKGEEAVRIAYDGRDSYVTTEVSRVRKLGFPNEWVHVETKGFPNRGSEAVGYAGSFIEGRFTA